MAAKKLATAAKINSTCNIIWRVSCQFYFFQGVFTFALHPMQKVSESALRMEEGGSKSGLFEDR